MALQWGSGPRVACSDGGGRGWAAVNAREAWCREWQAVGIARVRGRGVALCGARGEYNFRAWEGNRESCLPAAGLGGKAGGACAAGGRVRVVWSRIASRVSRVGRGVPCSVFWVWVGERRRERVAAVSPAGAEARTCRELRRVGVGLGVAEGGVRRERGWSKGQCMPGCPGRARWDGVLLCYGGRPPVRAGRRVQWGVGHVPVLCGGRRSCSGEVAVGPRRCGGG